ncbi:MAG: energy transducer TonB [Paramuribaculum sp.]|nr:energy transducer TonB [Paramuribaculum sp.]MDE7452295.1 energy transducer TonB [Paramuribaculum sp.]
MTRLLIVCAVLLAAVEAQAQFRRVVTYQTVVSGNRLVEMEAFTFDSVDEQPHFPGGDGAMTKFINRERQYPHEAYAAGIQGRVLCSFIVNADGSISNAEVLRGEYEILNKEALRIISKMPKWVAGKIGGTSVPVYCIVPIPFRL